jgi:hypothetical protein
MDGVLDWIMIHCTVYIHTTWDYRRYSAMAILRTLQFTVTRALQFAVFTSRILATDLSVSLSLQITHGVFFTQPSSFLAIILQLPIPMTRLTISSIPLLPSSYPGRLALETRLFTSLLDYYSILLYAAEHFYIATLHRPRRKHCLY